MLDDDGTRYSLDEETDGGEKKKLSPMAAEYEELRKRGLHAGTAARLVDDVIDGIAVKKLADAQKLLRGILNTYPTGGPDFSMAFAVDGDYGYCYI